MATPSEPPAPQSHRKAIFIVIAIFVAVLAVAALLQIRQSILNGRQNKVHERKTVVPDVHGVAVQAAFGILASRGLCTGSVSTRTGSGPAGIVIDQHPPAGKQIQPLSRVSLVVSGPGGSLSPAELSQMNPECPQESG